MLYIFLFGYGIDFVFNFQINAYPEKYIQIYIPEKKNYRIHIKKIYFVNKVNKRFNSKREHRSFNSRFGESKMWCLTEHNCKSIGELLYTHINGVKYQ